MAAGNHRDRSHANPSSLRLEDPIRPRNKDFRSHLKAGS
jgi:hypothetical protein